MVDLNTRNTYTKLKEERDAAYAIFKRTPSVENAASYSAASQAFTSFCVETLTKLVEGFEGSEGSDPSESILTNIDAYKTCKHCGSNLLYPMGNGAKYLCSSDFLADFPGWCHTCLAEYCCEHSCDSCEVATKPSTCSFKGIKQAYLQNL